MSSPPAAELVDCPELVSPGFCSFPDEVTAGLSLLLMSLNANSAVFKSTKLEWDGMGWDGMVVF